MIKVAHPSTTLLYAFFQASLRGLTFNVDIDGVVHEYAPQDLLILNSDCWPQALTGRTVGLNISGYPCGALSEEDITQGDICDDAVKLHFLQSLTAWKIERESTFREFDQFQAVLSEALTQEGDRKLSNYLTTMLNKQLVKMI